MSRTPVLAAAPGEAKASTRVLAAAPGGQNVSTLVLASASETRRGHAALLDLRDECGGVVLRDRDHGARAWAAVTVRGAEQFGEEPVGVRLGDL